MSPTLTPPARVKWTPARIICILTRGFALTWAAFWLWFAVAVSISEGPPPWTSAALLLAMFLLPPLLMRASPSVGGLAFILVAVVAVACFPSVAALLLLALPAAIVGLLLLTFG